jgi:hypothetical protein
MLYFLFFKSFLYLLYFHSFQTSSHWPIIWSTFFICCLWQLLQLYWFGIVYGSQILLYLHFTTLMTNLALFSFVNKHLKPLFKL